MDDINLFSVITVLSFLLSCPLMLFAEGVKFTPGYLQGTVSVLKIQTILKQLCHHSQALNLELAESFVDIIQGLNLQELCIRAALAGFCFHGYQKVRR
jgi:solute carrier family 35 protein E1